MERFEPYQTSKMERFEKIADDFTGIFLWCDKLTSCLHNAILKKNKKYNKANTNKTQNLLKVIFRF